MSDFRKLIVESLQGMIKVLSDILISDTINRTVLNVVLLFPGCVPASSPKIERLDTSGITAGGDVT